MTLRRAIMAALGASLALLVATGSSQARASQDAPTTRPGTQPTTQPAPRATAVARAHAMILAFLDGEVPRVRSLATTRMNAQLRDDNLRRLPGLSAEEHGGFVAMGETIIRYDREDPSLSIVLCPVFLQRGMLSFSTVVNADGQVASLRISSFAARGAAVAPPPYVDVALFSEETIQLPATAGPPRTLTLSLPRSARRTPAVLVVGMPEPHNRSESLGAIHIYRDIAQGLASRGIAAARFEEMAPAGGAGERVFQLPAAPTAAEIVAAMDALRARSDIDPGRLYIIAHGFAAAVAGRAVAEDAGRAQQGGGIAGLVLCAAPARPALEVVLGHVDALAKLDGRILPDEQALIDEAIALRAGAARVDDVLLGTSRANWKLLEALDAPGELRKALAADADLRVRILHANRDLQVSAIDLASWREVFAGERRVHVQVLPAVDHILSAGEGVPSPFDYIRPRPVAAELVLDLAEWILPGSTTRPAGAATRGAQPATRAGSE